MVPEPSPSAEVSSENITRFTPVEIANAAVPGMVLLRESERQVDLDLILHPEARFIDRVAAHHGGAASIHLGRNDQFILGISFLRVQCQRQVQLTRRPYRTAAEAAEATDHCVDLFWLRASLNAGIICEKP